MQYAVIPVTPFQQNCTVLWQPQSLRGAIIDPGGDLPRIERFLSDKGIELEKILLTHGHLDHAGAAAELAERHGVPVEGPHVGDKFWLDMIPQQAQMFGFTGRAVLPDRWLAQGDEVTVGGETLEVCHCPGHTPGHVIFFHRADQIAQVGDVLFAGSIGRTDFPGGNHAQLLTSIREQLWPLGDEVTFIPGHGPRSTLGHERRHNPFVAANYR